MTAQRSNFNSGVWAALEGRVRGWMCADTLYVDGMPFRRLADLDDRQRRQHAARTDAVLQGSAALEKRLDGDAPWHRFRPTNCRPSDSGTNTPNRRDRIRPVAPNRSRNRKTLRIRIFRQRPQRPESELSALGLGLMTHARNREGPARLRAGPFRIRQSWSHQNRRPAVAPVMPGGGPTRARTHPGAKVDSRPGGRDDACCAYPSRSNREDSDEVPENIAMRN